LYKIHAIALLHLVTGNAVVLEPVEQDDLVVTPDALTQIVDQFDDGHDLLG